MLLGRDIDAATGPARWLGTALRGRWRRIGNRTLRLGRLDLLRLGLRRPWDRIRGLDLALRDRSLGCVGRWRRSGGILRERLLLRNQVLERLRGRGRLILVQQLLLSRDRLRQLLLPGDLRPLGRADGLLQVSAWV